jgi:hypothetical protein
MDLAVLDQDVGAVDVDRDVGIAEIAPGEVELRAGGRILEVQAAPHVHRARVAGVALMHVVPLLALLGEGARLFDQLRDFIGREQGGGGGG